MLDKFLGKLEQNIKLPTIGAVIGSAFGIPGSVLGLLIVIGYFTISEE
jgi:hypothetical protein